MRGQKSMKKKIGYDFFLWMVLLFLFCLCSFYTTLSYGNSFDELRESGNYLNMWLYTFFGEGKAFIVICPIVIIYFGCKNFHKIYHTGYIENIIQRQKYSKFLNSSILRAWLKCFYFYGLYSTITLLLCVIVFKNAKFDMYYLAPIGRINPILVYALSIALSSVFSVIITNISLIFSKYYEKFSLAVILSYLFFLGYSIFSEIIIGNVFNHLITGERIADSFSMFNMVILDGNIVVIIIYSILLLLISTIIVKFIYRDKSEVLLSANQKK